jgi:type IV pilus biogenesis protein CpaD/CtpE
VENLKKIAEGGETFLVDRCYILEAAPGCLALVERAFFDNSKAGNCGCTYAENRAVRIFSPRDAAGSLPERSTTASATGAKGF